MTELNRDAFADAFDALDTGIIIIDDAQRVVYWNYWLASASGIAANAAVGQLLTSLFPERPLGRLTLAISEALDLGASALLTHSLNRDLLSLRTRTGLSLLHNLSVRPLGPKPHRHCLIQIADVTTSAHRERVLRDRQNARYDAVVESASDSILTIDADGHVQFANPAALYELGYERHELVGRPLGPRFEHPEQWRDFWSAVQREDKPPRSVALTAIRKNGSKTFLDVSASKWVSEGRTFVTAILRDVNERHAAEAALRELNTNLEQRVAERTQERDRVWQVSLDMLGVASPDGVWISINPAWRKTLGWEPGDLLGKTSDWLEHEDERGKTTSAFRLLGAQQTLNFESSFRSHNGEYRVLSWTAVNAEGLLYCVARDVTEQRRQQDALAKAEDALRQSQKMEAVGQLTGGLAHDFNNLLTGISGALELLQMRIAKGRYADVERYISTAQGAANRAAALTHRLLAFSRRQTLDPKATDVNRLIAGMADLIRNSMGPGIDVTINEGNGLWTTLVDPNQLENALLNLCINARDAMPDGGRLQIFASNRDFDASEAAAFEMRPGGYVCLAVSDTGTGMPEEVAKRAFDPFYTTKPLGQGTGLGLSMIYGFAKQSDGQVRISSEMGRGTTVTLFLPRHRDDAEVESNPTGPQSSSRANSGETVLIVDDEPSIRMLVTEVLTELGYTAIEAADGAAALPVLRSNQRVDLLVTDVGLPGGMNGRQVADFGRAVRPALKVLFITGYAEKSVMSGGDLDENMALLTKPFAMEDLAAGVKDLLVR